ncbi:MAG: HisA/HisF-related TIM barrel protein [Actinomycetota bacterium]
MTGRLELLPAVDVRGGRTAQVEDHSGAVAPELLDPRRATRELQRQGAAWIHLVDLDRAHGRIGQPALLAELVDLLDVDVQLSGGIHDDDSLAAALATGCRRINLATDALARPAWCSRVIADHGGRLAVGLDVRGRSLVSRGTGVEVGDLHDAVAWLDAAGCARYVVTDVDRDGSGRGPNLELVRTVRSLTDRPLVASGGVADLTDLDALASLPAPGVEGVIVGTALYDGRLALAEALRRVGPPS